MEIIADSTQLPNIKTEAALGSVKYSIGGNISVAGNGPGRRPDQ